MRILIVEDQIKTSQFLKKGFSEVGYSADIAESGSSAQSFAASAEYDLIILDLMLPDQSGLVTAQNLRKDGFSGPILMLSALSSTKDKVNGLDCGADDYMTKPFSFDELLARVRALLRRNSKLDSKSDLTRSAAGTTLKYADLEVDLIHRKVTRQNQEIQLTSKEFSLLEYFLRNPERPLGRNSIAEHVWDIDFDSESNVIDVYINLLRKKVDSPYSKKLIQTVVGVGYVLKELNS